MTAGLTRLYVERVIAVRERRTTLHIHFSDTRSFHVLVDEPVGLSDVARALRAAAGLIERNVEDLMPDEDRDYRYRKSPRESGEVMSQEQRNADMRQRVDEMPVAPGPKERPPFTDPMAASTLPPYMQRVIAEMHELNERIVKLRAFVRGQDFVHLPHEEQERLWKQGFYMSAYFDVLKERVIAFGVRSSPPPTAPESVAGSPSPSGA